MRANVYDTDGERVLWLKIMMIEVDKKEPITYLIYQPITTEKAHLRN